jgi:RNA 3'-terminal phosphate cyclase (ATP)
MLTRLIQTGTRVNEAALKILKQRFREPDVKYEVEFVQETPQSAVGNGCGITIVAETSTSCFFGGSALLEQGKSGDDVGTEAARKLISDFDDGGCVDEFSQDQVIIFMALAKGRSRIRSGPLSLHTQTSIHFSSLMTGVRPHALHVSFWREISRLKSGHVRCRSHRGYRKDSAK